MWFLQRAFALLLAFVSNVGATLQPQDMVFVPAGSFTMGRDDGNADEAPQYKVTLGAFEIDKFQVTNRQFSMFLNQRGPVDFLDRRFFDWDDPDARIHRVDGVWLVEIGFEDHPAIEVSWLGALSYCQWLAKRLPTEAEWERAARGDDDRPFPWGHEQPNAALARFESGWNQTVPVNFYSNYPTPYGVVGMAGNAWHWVSSAYRPYPYTNVDGREDLTPGPTRVTRGGAHDSKAHALRTTERGQTLSRSPSAGHHNIGFRCAR